MAEHINLLGLDFGSKRIGAAFASQASTEPVILPPISARDGIPDWQQVNKMVKEWQIPAFVVGIPYNMDGSVGEMAHRARKFANRLASRFDLPSYVVDERLSTYAAKEVHLAQGGGTNWKKNGVDGIAAQMIIESWFAEYEHRLASQPFKEQG